MKKNRLILLSLCLFMCACTKPMAKAYQVTPKALANNSSFALIKEAIGKVYNARQLHLTYSGVINGQPVSGQADQHAITSPVGQKLKFVLYNLSEGLTQNQQKRWEGNAAYVSLDANSKELNALLDRFVPSYRIGLKSASLQLSYHADGRPDTAWLHFSSEQYTGELYVIVQEILF